LAITALVAVVLSASCSGSSNNENGDGGVQGAASSSSGGLDSESGSSGSNSGSGSGANAESGTCSAGQAAITLASGQAGPMGIAIDSTSVYWTNTANGGDPPANGVVMKVALNGGTPSTLASGQNNPWAIAVDSTSVYWTNSIDNGSVMKVPLDGGTITTLASGQSDPKGITVDGASIYWTNTSGESDGNGTVLKVPLDGGTVTTLASVTPNELYGGVLGGRIAVDGTSAYWTGGTDGQSVMKVPLAGGTPTTLASGQSYPFGVAVDVMNVYWTDQGPVAAFPGVPSASPPANVGTVMKVSLGGGTITTLACGQSNPAGIVVDATSVYWTNPISGTVMKLPK
jgi:hypothetical protein